MVEYSQNLQKDNIIKPDKTTSLKDFRIYGRWMNDAGPDKIRRVNLGLEGVEISEGAVFLDVGSGTGFLAEYMAEAFRGAKVFAVDISHELREMAADKPFIGLIWDDATTLSKVPDNSVDVVYTHTTWHEIDSRDGYAGIEKALAAAFRVLKPGGRFVSVDMVKPEYAKPVYLRIDARGDGLDDIKEAIVNGQLDYSKLSTRAIFECFHKKFRGGKAFSYEIVNEDNVQYIKLPADIGQEFILHKDYRANFPHEAWERYLPGTRSVLKLSAEKTGFTNVKVVYDDSKWIRTHRLHGQVAILIADERGQLKEVEFSTHFILSADKPAVEAEVKAKVIPRIDYQEVLDTIVVDELRGEVRIGDKIFPIGKFVGAGAHKRVYEYPSDNGKNLLKVVRQDERGAYTVHNIFKAMTQALADERRQALIDYQVPHMDIVGWDQAGPPYRYLIQEALPEKSDYGAVLIRGEGKWGDPKLTERDVRQICEIVNRFEFEKRWQLDMSPFNWARVTLKNGETQMVYTGSTVYAYDENWVFAKMGILEWSDPQYVPAGGLQTAKKPTRSEIKDFLAGLPDNKNQVVRWFLKYLSPAVVQS